MKKILSTVLIMVLLFSMFGCKSKPIADDEEVYVEKEQTEQPADVGESEQQQREQEQSDEQPFEQNENEPEPEQQTEQTELDKAPPCTATIDDDFVDNEINVTLTKNESRKQKEYTAENFPELDIENIYYLFNYYPDTDGYAILNIVLQNHDKQKVLDGIRILEGYDIVYRAEPVLTGTIIHSENENEITLEQMESIISEMSITPCYSPTDLISEYNADLSTLV